MAEKTPLEKREYPRPYPDDRRFIHSRTRRSRKDVLARRWVVKDSVRKTGGALVHKIAKRRGWDVAQMTEYVNAFFDEVHCEMMRHNSVVFRRIGELRTVRWFDKPRTRSERHGVHGEFVLRTHPVFIPASGAFHNPNDMDLRLCYDGVNSVKELEERMSDYIQRALPDIQDANEAVFMERIEALTQAGKGVKAQKMLDNWLKKHRERREREKMDNFILDPENDKLSPWMMLPDNEYSKSFLEQDPDYIEDQGFDNEKLEW